jgi:predicted DNA-binding transcriptional regulator AlpA
MKVLSFPDLKAQKGIRYSRQWINHLVNEGRFPRPINLGPNYRGWLDHEIDEHLRAQAAARDAAASEHSG